MLLIRDRRIERVSKCRKYGLPMTVSCVEDPIMIRADPNLSWMFFVASFFSFLTPRPSTTPFSLLYKYCSGNGKFFRPGKKFLRPPADDEDDDDDDDDDDHEEEENSSEDDEDKQEPPSRVIPRGGGKSFSRPAPPAEEEEDSSDEDDDEEEEEEDNKAPARVIPRGGGKSLGKRPPPASANLSSDDDDSEDEEEEEQPKKGKKRVQSESEDDDDEEEDDEEEEEEEEEEKNTRKRKKNTGGGKKSKRPKAASFFDEEAADDDDEDDEPYGTHRDPDDVVRKHYTEEDIRKEQMDEEAQELIKQQDRRRALAGYRFGGHDSHEDDQSVQDMAREIEKRHRMSRRQVDRSVLDRHVRTRVDEEDDDVPGGPEVYTAVSQQSLVPSVSDPSLWMVSCSNGKEQEMVLQIMNKCVAFARQGRPLGICGAIAAQTKGRIYIESFSEPAVVEAINGVRGLLQYTMRLVPIQDMTTVMTVVATKKPGMKSHFYPSFPSPVSLIPWFFLYYSQKE